MITFLLSVQSFYESYYLNTTTEFSQWAAIYGWFAAASLVTALILLVFVLFRREQARTFAGFIFQHIFVIALPWLIEPLSNITGGWL